MFGLHFQRLVCHSEEVKATYLTSVLFCFQDLENYILELIPTLPQLDGLEKSFYSFYVCTAVRKFFFFLDPLRTGKKIYICNLNIRMFFIAYCLSIGEVYHFPLFSNVSNVIWQISEELQVYMRATMLCFLYRSSRIFLH